MSRREKVRVTVIALAALAVVMSDWPLGKTSGFASAHPFVAAVIGDLLMILVAGTVIGEYFAHRSRVIRARVISVAQDDLANQYNLTRRLLLQLPGVECFDDRATRPLSAEASESLNDLLSIRFMGMPYSRDLDDLSTRLFAVVEDSQWLVFANVQLQARQVEWRRVLAQWSPTMLSDRVLSEVLLTAAAFNHRISLVQVPIINFARSQEPTESDVLALVETWKALVDELLLEMERISQFAAMNRAFDMGSTSVGQKTAADTAPSTLDPSMEGG